MLSQIIKFCDMGGYGVYVWPCYVLFLTVVAWQIFGAMKRNIKVYNKVKDNVWFGTNSDKQT